MGKTGREVSTTVMNVFDILIVIIVIGLAVSGYREGLVRGAVKLAGFIITIVITAAISGRIVQLSRSIEFIPHEIAVPVLFVIFFIMGIIGFHLLAKILHDLIHMTPVGFVDSGLGCAFGILKALLVGAVLALALSFAPHDTFFDGQYRTSRTAQPLVRLLSESVPFVKRTIKTLYKHDTPQHDHENEKNGKSLPENII